MSLNQRLDFNQEIVDNFMLFIHNMQLQQNSILSAQISQLSIFNSLLHSSARERVPVSRTNSLPHRRPTRIFLNRNNNSNLSPTNFSTFGSFLNSNVEVFPSSEQINNATEIVTYNTINSPQNTSCPIRNENFRDDDIVIRMNHCGHIFYPNEFYGWFRNHVRCPMCRHDIRDSSNNVTNNSNIEISNNNLSNQRQFDICYNIFGNNQQPIPPPSSEALSYLTSGINNRNNDNNASHNNASDNNASDNNNSDSLDLSEFDICNNNIGEIQENQIASIGELTRTMASELMNQLQNNMLGDVSNNQIEMSFSFMTPTIITSTEHLTENTNDSSMNEID